MTTTPSDNEGLREDVQLLEAIDNILVPDGYSKTVLEREGEFRQRVTITPDTAEKLMALISQKIKDAYIAGANSVKGTFEQVALEARIDELKRLNFQEATGYLSGGNHILRQAVVTKRIASLTTKQDTKS